MGIYECRHHIHFGIVYDSSERSTAVSVTDFVANVPKVFESFSAIKLFSKMKLVL